MNYMGGLALQRTYNNWYNGSRRNLLVASLMDLQVVYVNVRGKRYVQVYQIYNDKIKRFDSEIRRKRRGRPADQMSST